MRAPLFLGELGRASGRMSMYDPFGLNLQVVDRFLGPGAAGMGCEVCSVGNAKSGRVLGSRSGMGLRRNPGSGAKDARTTKKECSDGLENEDEARRSRQRP